LDVPINAVLAALLANDPKDKCQQVAALSLEDVFTGEDVAWRVPGRPERPALVSPKDVPQRGLGSAAGRAALLHAVAHIEFNAINLALDAAWRFKGLPESYYQDWLSVAKDEARHFGLVQQRLQALGFAYGDFPAHNGLWEAAEKTRHDVLVRMACVPRVLEARGLDVTPAMIVRLEQVQDPDSAAVLKIILAEELGHVAIGSRWFLYFCQARGLAPEATFKQLLQDYGMVLKPPFNTEARLQAGFSLEEFSPA
jgi:uncharacterized ferritin-like protein (DUF455 family)